MGKYWTALSWKEIQYDFRKTPLPAMWSIERQEESRKPVKGLLHLVQMRDDHGLAEGLGSGYDENGQIQEVFRGQRG